MARGWGGRGGGGDWWGKRGLGFESAHSACLSLCQDRLPPNLASQNPIIQPSTCPSSGGQTAEVALDVLTLCDVKDQEYYAATEGFEERCRAYMELAHPTVALVVQIDTYMKKVQAALALQGARGQKKWQMATAALLHATDAHQIARLITSAQDARGRVEKYNMDVVAFNTFRDHLYSSEAHKQVMELSKRVFPDNTTSK